MGQKHTCPGGSNTETEMSSFWWNFHHWLHWKLSKWQLPVQPVIKISSKWRHFRFSEIQWSAVITRSNIVRYYINNYNNWERISLRYWIYKRHPIPHPNGWAMGHLSRIFVRKMTWVMTAPHCTVRPSSGIWPSYPNMLLYIRPSNIHRSYDNAISMFEICQWLHRGWPNFIWQSTFYNRSTNSWNDVGFVFISITAGS